MAHRGQPSSARRESRLPSRRPDSEFDWWRSEPARPATPIGEPQPRTRERRAPQPAAPQRPARQARAPRKRRPSARRRRHWRRRLLLVVLVLLVPVVYSYVTTVTRPSSLPLSMRSVEWLRSHGGAWLVNDVERYYYSWKAPKPGGAPLKRLPASFAHRVAPVHLAYTPARILVRGATRLAGEGVWQVAARAAGKPAVLVTAFRPEAAYPRTVAYAAWIDHTRTQVALYPGRYEPPNAPVRGPMAVPTSQRWRLLATFNSGFTFKDGHGGFALNGTTYEPLQRGLGTFVGYRNGRVDVISWRGGANAGRTIAFARQNLPLLVANRRPSPQLADSGRWGATLGNAVRVWRSGVGIDRRGNVIYVAANYQTAASLAQGLIEAGAVRAIQLDINAEWPSFNTYLRPGARDPSKIVPNDQQSATRYLVPDDRDFFAVFRRIGTGASSVPLR